MRHFLALILLLFLVGCSAAPTQPETVPPAENNETMKQESLDMIKLTIGNHVIYAVLDNNSSTDELAALLKSSPIIMSASNYGGFEKVCALGTRITSNDAQITTQAGDIMLYSSNQIVIFYGSNRWAYTRLGRVTEEFLPNLRNILSGDESEVIMELA